MANDISQRIKNSYSTFSKGHKKLANAILNNYDKVAYMTAARLAITVGVSESTVVRFANVLGFEGYSEFQRALKEFVRTRLTPNQRIKDIKYKIRTDDILKNVMESDINKIRYTLDRIDKDTFNKAVDSILSAKNIYVMGSRSTEPLALVLKYNLSLIFDNVKFIQPTSSDEAFLQILSIGEDDVLIAFSFPRCSSETVSLVKYARNNLSNVVLFTDSEISPLAEYATSLLTAHTDMASFTDSLVAPMSLINAIIVEITRRREKEITARFDKLDKLGNEYGVDTKR